jgi:hypothetical protein
MTDRALGREMSIFSETAGREVNTTAHLMYLQYRNQMFGRFLPKTGFKSKKLHITSLATNTMDTSRYQ